MTKKFLPYSPNCRGISSNDPLRFYFNFKRVSTRSLSLFHTFRSDWSWQILILNFFKFFISLNFNKKPIHHMKFNFNFPPCLQPCILCSLALLPSVCLPARLKFSSPTITNLGEGLWSNQKRCLSSWMQCVLRFCSKMAWFCLCDHMLFYPSGE